MTDLAIEEAPVIVKPAYEPAEFVDYGKASALIGTNNGGTGATDGGAVPTNYIS